jgi:hypothetical protein
MTIVLDDHVARKLPDAILKIEFAGATFIGLYADASLSEA